MPARTHIVTRPTPKRLPGLELGSSTEGRVVAVGVASSWLFPVTSLKIVVESSCGLYESIPSGMDFPVALS